MELVVLTGAALLADLTILDSRERSRISVLALLVLLGLSLVWLACVVICLQGGFSCMLDAYPYASGAANWF